jgi:hypothetical protein
LKEIDVRFDDLPDVRLSRFGFVPGCSIPQGLNVRGLNVNLGLSERHQGQGQREQRAKFHSEVLKATSYDVHESLGEN